MSVTTVTASDFVRKAEEIWSAHKGCTYRNGSSGQKENGVYYCDCRGYLLWTLRSLGISASSPGTNWMVRNQMNTIKPFSNASELSVGMAVFKAREKGASGWDLPDKYKKNGKSYNAQYGETDFYHVGIVVSTSPLTIRNCTTGGIKTDTTLGKWNWAGWVQWVTENEETTPSLIGTVIADSGKTVNLRKEMSTKSQLVERIPIGTNVTVISEQNGWKKVKYKHWSGYIMSCFVKMG